MTVRTAAATPEHDVGSDASLAYLLGRVALLEVAVRGAAARRSHDDPDPTDSLRGVYLSDDYVGWLLDRHATGPADQAAADLAAMRDQLEREADGAEARGYDVRLRRLRRDAALTPLEEDLLVVALAPMIDQRFGQLFGYLNDDVTRRYATISLATELARHRHPADPRDWMLLRPGSRLVDRGLVEVTDPEQPLPTRSVRVAERVLAFLVGDDTASPEIADLLVEPTLLPLVDPGFAGWAQPRSALVRQGPGTDAEVEAATWLASGGPAPLVARLTGPVAELHDLVRQLLRECLLLRRPLVVGPVSRRTLGEGADRLERLLPSDTVVVLWTDVDEAARPGEGLDRIDLAVPSVEHRTRAWRLLCPEGGLAGSDLALLGARHRIGAARIQRALTTAAADGGLDRTSVERGVRAQDGAAMQGQARRITPRRTWSDLVLPEAIHRQLRELTGMVRHRDEVVERWGLGRGDGAGVTALFAGHSGTGKTLAAEVVARELGVDLYTVDLSRVVDKYVGETEKNLDRLLTAAEGVTGLIFFDEADALFGRRGEVTNGQDRYANLEVSFLLQRMEALGAVVVLATNLRSQVDSAFVRRLDSVIEFGLPETEAREAIWRRHLARLEMADDADVAFCARAFELSGGNIRNVVAAAACLAADAGRPVGMADLVRGVEREQEKLGRLRVTADFGRYAPLLAVGP